MAKHHHEAVDFSPAWLNFNNSNKKKPEKAMGVWKPALAATFSLDSPTRATPDPPSPFGTNLLGLCSSASHLRSSSTSSFRSPHSPSTKSGTRHLSVGFSPSYLDSKTDQSSPGREYKGHTKLLAFTPTLVSSKSYLNWNKNGLTPLHPTTAGGDGNSGLDTEFPSLSDGDSSEQSKLQNSPQLTLSRTPVNMWQKPLVLKNTEPHHLTDQRESSESVLSSSIYKTLVPKTSASNQKQSYRRTLSNPLVSPTKIANSTEELITTGSKRDKDGATNQSMAPKFLTGNTSNLRLAKSELQNSVNLSVVSGHKKHKQGKNQFLQTLRQTENEVESAGGVNFLEKAEESKGSEEVIPAPVATADTSNVDYWFNEKESTEITINDENTSFEDSILSRSLEAEHRLLKEMGWKHSDGQVVEEEPPLTEDEIQEFRIRCNGILPAAAAQRERALQLQNAFSGWKFSGIRRRNTDADYDDNSITSILQKQENGDSQDDEEFSSDDNDF